jgi:phosphatidate phosphatase APP1
LLRRVLLLRRSGKVHVIRSLLKAYPQRRFLLVGDSGERDPEIYGAMARRYPQQVAGVYIRRLSDEPKQATRLARAFRRLDPSLVRLFAEADELPRAVDP